MILTYKIVTMPDVCSLFMIRGAVQRALRATVALMDSLGEGMRNLVGFVGKLVLDVRGLRGATDLHR